MEILVLILIGIIGGVIGGMGMGGGTLLIPLLVIFGAQSQHIAQSINLLAFIPMSVIALIIHCRNHLVEFKQLFIIGIPAVILSVLASLFVIEVKGKYLSISFGIFLILLGIFQLICLITKFYKKLKNKYK